MTLAHASHDLDLLARGRRDRTARRRRQQRLGCDPGVVRGDAADAGSKVGVENVRQVKVDVPWDAIVAAFEPPKVEGTVQR
jgi:hypothetical protein